MTERIKKSAAKPHFGVLFAKIAFAPLGKLAEDREHCFAFFGEGVFDVRRDFVELLSVNNLISLQVAQGRGKHCVCYFRQCAFQLAKSA